MVETLAAQPPTSRRRRSRAAETAEPLAEVPLTRATAVLAYRPFDREQEAAVWLAEVADEDDLLEGLISEGAGLLNRAIHAGAVAAADHNAAEVSPDRALRVKIGYGSGEEVASGRFTVAREVDLAGTSRRARRRRREADLQPQERLAALLGARERADACETLLLRARADLDAGRVREAALQLRVTLEAMLVELAGALPDSGHEQDMAELESRRAEVGEAGEAALRGELDPGRETQVRELVALAERVIRRRRILRG